MKRFFSITIAVAVFLTVVYVVLARLGYQGKFKWNEQIPYERIRRDLPLRVALNLVFGAIIAGIEKAHRTK